MNTKNHWNSKEVEHEIGSMLLEMEKPNPNYEKLNKSMEITFKHRKAELEKGVLRESIASTVKMFPALKNFQIVSFILVSFLSIICLQIQIITF